MKPSLQLRVSQHLALTPQLQQSIRLLQLSTLELQQEIQGMLDANPFLEDEASGDNMALAQSEAQPFESLSGLSTPSAQTEESSYTADGVGELTEMNWAQASDSDMDDDLQPMDAADWDGGDFSNVGEQEDNLAAKDLEWVSTSESLAEHLLMQAKTLRLSHEDAAALMILIESLDENGYLTDDLTDIADRLLAARQNELDYMLEHEDMLERLQCALGWLQSLEPSGVGARNLSECLKLQLKQKPVGDVQKLALAICTQYLDVLAKRDHRKLASLLQVSEEQIRKAFQMILTLDPKPGRQYAQSSGANIIPDVLVKKSGLQWKASLNPEVMPKIRVNDIYARALRGHKGSDGAQALTQRLQEARWFIKNIQQRFETILRVSQAIVNRQKNFFNHGEIAMRPLVLREIADELGLHESTISRVTTAKYMMTPYGIFELKYFFGSALATETGGNASSTAVRALIKQLISEEDSHKPLSDNEISKLLSEQGIQVARRTVAKYREGLKIAPANMRKAI